jgi:hypothetical protein
VTISTAVPCEVDAMLEASFQEEYSVFRSLRARSEGVRARACGPFALAVFLAAIFVGYARPAAADESVAFECRVSGPPGAEQALVLARNSGAAEVRLRYVVLVHSEGQVWRSSIEEMDLAAGQKAMRTVASDFEVGRELEGCTVDRDADLLHLAEGGATIMGTRREPLRSRPAAGGLSDREIDALIESDSEPSPHEHDGWRWLGAFAFGAGGAIGGAMTGALIGEKIAEGRGSRGGLFGPTEMLIGGYLGASAGVGLGAALAWNLGESETSYLAAMGGGVGGALLGIGVAAVAGGDAGVLPILTFPPAGAILAAFIAHEHPQPDDELAVGALLNVSDKRLSLGMPLLQVGGEQGQLSAYMPVLGGRF